VLNSRSSITDLEAGYTRRGVVNLVGDIDDDGSDGKRLVEASSRI
jgi:hypothetical protein